MTPAPITAGRLGLGVSGPHGAAVMPARMTADLVRAAFGLGVRVFDTGPSYGEGEAERRLGQALAALPRADCIVSTKAGITASGVQRRRDFSVDAVRRSLDGSLTRLGCETIDWLFLHGPSPQDMSDALLKALEAEVAAGRIGRLGVCGRGEEIDAALALERFDVVMAPVHAGLEHSALQRLARVKAAGVMLVGIETLSQTLKAYPFPASFGAAYRLARSLYRGPLVARRAPMTAAKAFAWAIGEGGADFVVTTTTRLAHLRANAAAIAQITRAR
jgi:aryl-alcohol dehydrogenase-like predicted oxidoreductase